MSDTEESTPSSWEELAEVGRYPSLEQAQEHALVILAMREPCWVAEPDAGGAFSLHAERAQLPAILQELSQYDEEQRKPSPPPVIEHETFRYSAGWDVYGIWAACVIGMYLLQSGDPSLVERAASSSTGLLERQEWWRPFTALFLHADPPHLIGNLLGGMFFGSLVARSIGAWRGWALILVCGALGNAITSSLTWPEPFTSIGASTAVFAALGILSGIGVATMLRARFRLPWAKVTAPLVAGVILLGWLGGGSPGGDTDVMGHVCGFTCGLGSGFLIGRFSERSTETRA
jgi:rhomboid protease GluP